MNNQERKQLRIRRSKDQKAEKRKPRIEKYGTFENVNTIQNHLHSLQKRRKDTEWKGSVQSYIQHAPVKIYRAKHDLNDGVLNVNQTIRHLVVNERGKRRNCHAIMIDSRVIQGSLCDSSITPLTQPSLIYDNPASTKGKGVSFARRRVDCLTTHTRPSSRGSETQGRSRTHTAPEKQCSTFTTDFSTNTEQEE